MNEWRKPCNVEENTYTKKYCEVSRKWKDTWFPNGLRRKPLSEQLLVEIPGVRCGTLPALSSRCGLQKMWIAFSVLLIQPWITVYNLCWLWIPIDQAGIFLMLSSFHPPIRTPSDLCALQQGQATQELLHSASSLAGLQGRGEQMGTWTGVPGNQQPDPAHPITWLHVAPAKSPINWSDCPVDWKRELCGCSFSLAAAL